MKRMFPVFLALLLALLPGCGGAGEAPEPPEEAGDPAAEDSPFWVLRDGVLTVGGSGVLTEVLQDPEAVCSITEVVIGDGITSLPDSGFQGYSALTSVTMGKGVASIGAGTFAGCAALETVSISSGATEIGEGAFEGCVRLTVLAPGGSCAETYARENGIPFSTAEEAA